MKTKKQILLVEDDLRLSKLIGSYLSKQGFGISIERRGDTAVTRILRETPDLVVLDLLLPGMDGRTVCQQVRSDYQGPILMLTALEDDMDQMKDVVETAITGFSDIAAEYHLNQKDRQCTVRFEPRFMCRALTNLSRNAAKYASCCIRISFEKRGPDCVIHVDDDVLAFPKRIANESSGPFWR